MSTELEASDLDEAPKAEATETTAPANTDTDDAAKWKALARKHEAQAKANAEAAKRLSEIEESQKTETQKLIDRAEKAERELLQARTTALIARAAKKYGIPDDLSDFLDGATEEDIEAKAVKLAESIAAAKRPGDDVPTKPRPKLTPGQGADSVQEDQDVAAIAAKIRNSLY
jgi:hypothetical protein